MIFKKSPEKFWDLISARYAASPISDITAYETKIETIKSYLSPEDVVLDIGCGTGTQCGDLAGNVKQVTGIDISGKNWQHPNHPQVKPQSLLGSIRTS